jgi:hypothetical protein
MPPPPAVSPQLLHVRVCLLAVRYAKLRWITVDYAKSVAHSRTR